MDNMILVRGYADSSVALRLVVCRSSATRPFDRDKAAGTPEGPGTAAVACGYSALVSNVGSNIVHSNKPVLSSSPLLLAARGMQCITVSRPCSAFVPDTGA